MSQSVLLGLFPDTPLCRFRWVVWYELKNWTFQSCHRMKSPTRIIPTMEDRVVVSFVKANVCTKMDKGFSNWLVYWIQKGSFSSSGSGTGLLVVCQQLRAWQGLGQKSTSSVLPICFALSCCWSRRRELAGWQMSSQALTFPSEFLFAGTY
jgi:hypothetical protein